MMTKIDRLRFILHDSLPKQCRPTMAQAHSNVMCSVHLSLIVCSQALNDVNEPCTHWIKRLAREIG